MTGTSDDRRVGPHGRVTQTAPGGGRGVVVDPERLAGWISRFTERHGVLVVSAEPTAVTFSSADGTVAECRVPFPPLAVDGHAADGGLVAHTLRDRRVGVLLVRLGGHAVGVFDGSRLLASKVGSRQVHGRSAAGGWSQHRFARRREGQVKVALAAAVGIAAEVLLPVVGELDALVLGGDRRALDTVLEDRRLRPLRALVVEPVLNVPDPRLRILTATPQDFRRVRIRLREPTDPTP